MPQYCNIPLKRGGKLPSNRNIQNGGECAYLSA
jgi:hypothetical protein